ncbi:MAG: AGE family epimerase/isomerase [Mobilitalea sp.]
MEQQLEAVILPYWKGLIDRRMGGYYGLVNFDLEVKQHADKGVILNSRILWFFSNAYLNSRDESLLPYAKHAYDFLTEHCLDREYGGVYWMMAYDTTIKEDIKHTYNQAFAIYALSAYYEATKEDKALSLALDLFLLIEEKCTDTYGYLEAFTRDWVLIDNDKLSENGLLADKTMNTLLHVLEAYTLLYKVSKDTSVKEKLIHILKLFQTKIYNPEKVRLEVFFNESLESITDIHSYGHDIEASWLLDEACRITGEKTITEATKEYTRIIAERIRRDALEGDAVLNECFLGKVDKTRVWWVQAEAVVGFYNAYEKTGERAYLETSKRIWNYIKTYFIDQRPGSEWLWDLDENDQPSSHKPITEPWKCPYHNGRMCFEIIRRMSNV